MEKISPTSSWNLKPLPKQIIRITKYERILGINSETSYPPANRREARDYIYKLRIMVKEKNNA